MQYGSHFLSSLKRIYSTQTQIYILAKYQITVFAFMGRILQEACLQLASLKVISTLLTIAEIKLLNCTFIVRQKCSITAVVKAVSNIQHTTNKRIKHTITESLSPLRGSLGVSRGGVEDTRLEAKAKDTKKSEAKAKDSLSEDRHSRGQGHKRKCSPKQKKRSSQKFFRRSPKKKKVLTKIFQAISTKNRFPKNFSSAPQNFNIPKNSAVLEPRTGQFSRT